MNSERLIGQFFEMVKIESPSFRESSMAAYCQAELESLGFDVRYDNSSAKTGSDTNNLIADLAGTTDGHIMFCAHLDTVVPCENIEPVIEVRDFGSEGEGEGVGELMGEGEGEGEVTGELEVIVSSGETILSADDKAGIAAIFEGVRSVLEDGCPRPAITVLLTTCEERELLGSSAIEPNASYEGVPCFVLDADGAPGSIIVGAPYHFTFSAEFTGRSAHAGVEPEAGINAILAASRAVAKMPLGRIAEHATANVGVIEGGDAVNIVPNHCTLKGECRSLYEDEAKSLKDAMDLAMEEAASETGASVDATWKLNYPGLRYSEDAEIVKHLQNAARACGIEPRLTITGGGADANVLVSKGVQAITLGVGMTNFHSVDEYIAVRDLENSARFVEAIIAEYAE